MHNISQILFRASEYTDFYDVLTPNIAISLT